MVIPDIGKKAMVCLQTWLGTYVCAEHGGGELVVVNRPKAKEWETFELHRIDENNISLKAHNGKYLCAEHGGGHLIVANRDEVKEWETFGLFIDTNGLVYLRAHRGQYLCAEEYGLLRAESVNPQKREAFLILDPAEAKIAQTKIEINVYKIQTAPLWHTGTVINNTEYYFNRSNKVETGISKGRGLIHHRTMVRFVPHNLEAVLVILNKVIDKWNGTRYDVSCHNCNFFTDELLKELGAPGLDQEYLNASGLAKGLRQLPGGATFQEVLLKWPIEDKRLDESAMVDLDRLVRLPADAVREVKNFFDTIKIPVRL